MTDIIRCKCIGCGEMTTAMTDDDSPFCSRCKMNRATSETADMAEKLFKLLTNLRRGKKCLN